MAGLVSRHAKFAACAFLLIPALLYAPSPTRANDIIYFAIGTGSVTGTYHPIGTLIANIISHPPGSVACADGGTCGVPNLIATAQTSQGSIANARAIQAGSMPSGFAQADVAHDAHDGTGAFSDEHPLAKLRALANLYPEMLHVVVRKDAGIKSVADLRGRRVSIDVPGSGTRLAAGVVLAEHGIGPGAYISEALTSDQAATLMRRGELDAFFIVAGMPARIVAALIRDDVASLVGLDPPRAVSIIAEHRFFSRSTIAEDIYRMEGDTPTIAVGAQWLVSEDVPDDLVHAICRVLWSDYARDELTRGHAQGAHITLETALDGVSIPLHPGAERCYRELGRLP